MKIKKNDVFFTIRFFIQKQKCCSRSGPVASLASFMSQNVAKNQKSSYSGTFTDANFRPENACAPNHCFNMLWRTHNLPKIQVKMMLERIVLWLKEKWGAPGIRRKTIGPVIKIDLRGVDFGHQKSSTTRCPSSKNRTAVGEIQGFLQITMTKFKPRTS